MRRFGGTSTLGSDWKTGESHTLEAVKIICISGMVEQDKIEDLKVAGANQFLQKPFTVDSLLDCACDQLEMERMVAG